MQLKDLYNAAAGWEEPDWDRYIETRAWPFHTKHHVERRDEFCESSGDDPIEGWFVSGLTRGGGWARIAKCVDQSHATHVANVLSLLIAYNAAELRMIKLYSDTLAELIVKRVVADQESREENEMQ